MDRARLGAFAERLRSLHVPGRPLVLANVWDAAGARLVVEMGSPVVATSSGAVARALGYEDDDVMPADEAFAAVARICAAVDVPVTADLEAGYGLTADAFAQLLLDAGAVGCNLEDTDHRNHRLAEPHVHAERIAAIKQAARALDVDIVLNARIDVFLRAGDGAGPRELAEAIERAKLYTEAGADSIFPIMMREESHIATMVAEVGAPVNVFRRDGVPSIARLAELGVARVSVGSALQRATASAMQTAVRELFDEARM